MTRPGGRDPYEVLGVDADADAAAVKSAWRRRSRQTHPDVGGDAGEFAQVQEAYRLLRDPDTRAAADRAAAGRPSGRAEDPVAEERHHARPAAERTTPWPRPRRAPRRTTLRVDPGALTWGSRTVSGDLRVRPAQLRGLPYVPFVGAFVSAGCAFALFTHLFAAGAHPSLREVVGVLLLGVTAVGAATRWWPAAAAAAVVGVGLGWFGWFVGGWVDVAAWGVALVALTAALAAQGWRRFGVPAGMDVLMPEASARSFNVFGTPGTPGHRDTADTRAAARMGDDALLPLTWFPATRTFHGVPFEESGRATSHVVVCGNRVAVVDTVVWLGGSYQFSPVGAVTCDGGHFAYGDTPVGDAVAAWQARLGSGVEVRGWVMVGSPVGEVVVANPEGPVARLGTPQQVVEEIGTWFADGEPLLVDRRTLFAFAERLVA